MKRYSGLWLGLFFLLTAGCAATVQPMRVSEDWQPRGKQRFERVLLVMLENQDVDKVLNYQHPDPHVRSQRFGGPGTLNGLPLSHIPPDEMNFEIQNG